ncbi:MAG: hypothetical protein FK733_19670 [Asgard group archaeon]|nr:hypothetical protein [Asgard group archaeon]
MIELLPISENPLVDVEFHENFKLLEKLMKQEKYKDGLRQALVFAEKYLNRSTEFYSWALEFCQALEDSNETLVLLEQAITNGAWWSADFLKLAYGELFADNEKFDRLLQLAVKNTPSKKMKAKLIVRTPEKYDLTKSYPLLLVLHGRGSNVEHSDKIWKSETVKRNMIVGFLQSSQLLSSVHYCWDDWEKAFIDIKAAYKTLTSKYTINNEKSIIGGVSAGAEVGLSALFEHILPFSKMISTITSTGTFIRNYIEKDKTNESLEVFFIVGEKDVRYNNTKLIHQYLKKTSLSSEFYSCPKIGHEIPNNFDEILEKAVTYLNVK